MTQSLTKRLAFDRFRPGWRKITQTGYTVGLERHLNKQQIAALFLGSVEMGQGTQGWMTVLFNAGQNIYQRPIPALTQVAFARLVAVLIAPGTYNLTAPDPELDRRSKRITALWRDSCAPCDHGDIWVQDCDPPSPSGAQP